jgi:hypothetical protein
MSNTPTELQEYLDAQDALDNREYAGINAEDYFVLMRRRNSARNRLDAVLSAIALNAPAGEVDWNAAADFLLKLHGPGEGFVVIVDRRADGGPFSYCAKSPAPQRDAPAGESASKIAKTAPKRIFLNIFTADEFSEFPADHEGITWCEDEVGDDDVEYIRADLAPSPPLSAQPAAEPVKSPVPAFWPGDRVIYTNEHCVSTKALVKKVETRWSNDRKPYVYVRVLFSDETTTRVVPQSYLAPQAQPSPEVKS